MSIILFFKSSYGDDFGVVSLVLFLLSIQRSGCFRKNKSLLVIFFKSPISENFRKAESHEEKQWNPRYNQPLLAI